LAATQLLLPISKSTMTQFFSADPESAATQFLAADF
jgi:hypothetical protein